MNQKYKGRAAIVARLLLLVLLVIPFLFYFDACVPVKLQRQTITTLDKIINETSYLDEEVVCKNTYSGREVYQLKHTISEFEYLSGRVRHQKTTDSIFMGLMSIDIPCPNALSFD